MKKRILVALVMVTCMVLAGCGSSVDPNAADSAPAEYAETLSPTEDVLDEQTIANDSVCEPEEQTTTKEDLNQVPEDDTVPWDETAEDEQSFEAEITTQDDAVNEVKGIVVVKLDWKSDSKYPEFEVVTIDPQTGTWYNIANFQFGPYLPEDGLNYQIQPATKLSRYTNLHDQFSADYTKVAATMTLLNTGETHAGWVDTNGEFFDITEALGEQSQSDFDGAKTYQTVGFHDDIFIYMDYNRDRVSDSKYYGVALDNITPGASWEIASSDPMIFDDYAEWGWLNGNKCTSWIDENHFLGEFDDGSKMVSVAEQTVTDYLPATDSRLSWNAVFNAETNNIAFFSLSKSSQNGDVGLYTMPLDGGANPVKVETDFAFDFAPQGTGRVYSYPGIAYVTSFILEWR